MESQKKKVVSRTFRDEFTNQYGTFYNFIVRFEGDNENYGYTSSEKEPKKFNVGEEQEFTIEEKPWKKKDGTNGIFKKVKPYKENTFQKGGGGYVFNLDNEKLKAKLATPSYALSYVKDLIISGKVKDEDALSKAKEYSDFLQREIDLI